MSNYNELLFIGFILDFRCCFVDLAFSEIILNYFSKPIFNNNEKLIITDKSISIDYKCNRNNLAKKNEAIHVLKLTNGKLIYCDVIDLRDDMEKLTQKIISLANQQDDKPVNKKTEDKKITKSEETIMTLFSSGLDAKEIAAKERKKIKTIYSHRRNALIKLGFKTINEYIIYKNWLSKNRWKP
ncbi:hypothetical protein I5N59_24565 [Serratia marcescens]|uniref:LuxR C-terminal-related transcriptional regulator n=1 Tax=Serratia marcescens TaxID=615 RepID=UPI0018D86052|nr:hypothetical protein [Serratia marcescens]